MIRQYAGLIAVTLAGLLVRTVGVDEWPLWGDEALTLIVAQWPLKTLFLLPVDPTPGLYYAFHKALLGPFVDVAAARSISVAAGTLLIPASFFLARKAQGPAVLTAALVALSFPLIDYSQEARAYSMLVLLVTLSAGFFVWWGRAGQLPLLAVSLLFGVLAFYTHFTAVFWVGPLGLAAAWMGRRQAIPLLLAMAILAVPEVSRLAHYHQQAFVWLLQASPSQAMDTVTRAVLPFRISGGWALLVALAIGVRAWMRRSQLVSWANANRAGAVAILVLLSVPLTVWLFGYIIKPIFMTRAFLISIPGFMFALALLLSFEHQSVRFGVVALYVGSLLVTGTMRPRENWSGIAQRVGGDTILMCQPAQGVAMQHATGGDRRILLRNGDGVIEIDGQPWQIAYFNWLTSDEVKRRAERKGRSIDWGLYPVWAVRTGSTTTLAEKPTTLAQAIRICDSNRADNAPQYRAE